MGILKTAGKGIVSYVEIYIALLAICAAGAFLIPCAIIAVLFLIGLVVISGIYVVYLLALVWERFFPDASVRLAEWIWDHTKDM